MKEAPITEIYFLLSGKVEYVLQEFNDTPYLTVSEGIYFGDLDIVRSLIDGDGIEGKRLFTAKAKEDCEVLILTQTDLFRLYHKYPEETAGIFEGAGARLGCVLSVKGKFEKGLRGRQREMNKAFRRYAKSATDTLEGNSTEVYTVYPQDGSLDCSEDLSIIDSMIEDSSFRTPLSLGSDISQADLELEENIYMYIDKDKDHPKLHSKYYTEDARLHAMDTGQLGTKKISLSIPTSLRVPPSHAKPKSRRGSFQGIPPGLTETGLFRLEQFSNRHKYTKSHDIRGADISITPDMVDNIGGRETIKLPADINTRVVEKSEQTET